MDGKRNSGVLFPNRNKKHAKQPDHIGRWVDVNGAAWRLAAWNKDGGKCISIQASALDNQTPDVSEEEYSQERVEPVHEAPVREVKVAASDTPF